MGLSISSDLLTIAVAVVAFFISGFFLLYLVPEGRQAGVPGGSASHGPEVAETMETGPALQQQQKPVTVPVETEGATRLIPCETICAVQATTHYTLVYDGQKEYLSPWSISEAEQRLPSQDFMRVHRSHIVALDKINALRRAGDGAAVEVGQPVPRVVPVSRSHYAELKSRLGLRQKLRSHAAGQGRPESGRPEAIPAAGK